MRRAVFIDRDGTFNVLGNYINKVEDLDLIPGSDKAVKLARDAGFLVIVVTNQAGVARGYYSEEDVAIFHQNIQDVLARFGTKIDAFYYCPYHPIHGKGKYLKDDECRKPKPGMLLQAAKEHGIDLENSYMIGDNIGDIQAGQAAGCRTIMVRTGYGNEHQFKLDELEEHVAAVTEDLLSAVEWILEEESQ